MNQFIDATTALPFWFSTQSDSLLSNKPKRTGLLTNCATNAARSKELVLPQWVSACTEKPRLVVPDDHHRCTPGLFDYHVARPDLPPRAFIRCDDGTWIASPEYCFVRMASVLDLPNLVKLGIMLCGSFVYDQDGNLEDRVVSATTAKSLRDFVGKMQGTKNVKKARRALRWVLVGSASPSESDTVILLCFPRMLGGYALIVPELNGHVRLNRKAESMLGYPDCYIDFLWRKQRQALEYSSKQHHHRYQDTVRDEIRRAALENMGYTVTFLTTEQLYNAVSFDAVVRSVARNLGKRIRTASTEELIARNNLRKSILYNPAPELQLGNAAASISALLPR